MIHRRSYNVLAQYLPKKHEFIVSVRLSKLQTALYQRYLSLHANLKDHRGLFKAFSNLSQLCAHPGLLELQERPAAERDAKGYESIDDFMVDSEDDEWSDDAARGGGSVRGKKKGKKGKKKEEKEILIDVAAENESLVNGEQIPHP